MCITPASSFAQTAGGGSASIPLIEDPNKFSILGLPALLPGFFYDFTKLSPRDEAGTLEYVFAGHLDRYGRDRICPHCHAVMHVKSKKPMLLRHVPIGGWHSFIQVEVVQFECPQCGKTHVQDIPFKALQHRMTKELLLYIVDLLSIHKCTHTHISHMTGVSKNTIKDIDYERLKGLYTTDGTTLKKPATISTYLAIDEFKLHNGHKYATHIIDLETGRILYVARGKKKQVVYDFIDLVGLGWMNNVEAIACDMNSDFQEAFQEKCPHVKIVFDHFHIVNNLNKYINLIRIAEQKRLINEGREEEASALKGMKYILLSSRDTLKSKDGSVAKSNDSDSNETPEKIYDKLIHQNKLLMTCDFVKEALKRAFSTFTREEMKDELEWIIELCKESEDKYLTRFANLIQNHMDGILSHTEYHLTSGKIEGINNKIKTIRRMHYGIPEDNYFFLMLLDINRKSYPKHPLFRINGRMVFGLDGQAA